MSIDTPPTATRSPTVPPPAARARRRRRWPPWLIGLVALVVVVGAAGQMIAGQQPAADPSAAMTPAPRLVARGRVVPVRQARVGTIGGGVITRLAVPVGQPVTERQEVATVRSASGAVEALTAPWAGTIMALPASLGDTVAPGATVAVVGDLTRLEVKTTDVDEFLINYVHADQPVTLTIEALERGDLTGYVRQVAIYPTVTATGDEHYPVDIALNEAPTGLRPGMSARVIFVEVAGRRER